jgi:GntR family transcriptional repressor for pyruvate dehydrogenase complex
MKTPGAAPRPKAALRVAQEIVQAIYDDRMQPGDRYFSEAEAMKRHGVPRSTLREALRFLEMQGVIRMRVGPGGGAIVGRPGWPNLASTMALLLQFDGADLQTVLEARRVIEPSMAELAVRNATEGEIAAMAGDLDALEASLGLFREWSQAYQRFWRRLAESTHNALIAFLFPALRALVDSGGFAPNEIYRSEILDRLRIIHRALASRDVDGARTAMRELEDGFFARIAEGYPRQMKRQVAWADLDLSGIGPRTETGRNGHSVD